MLNTPIQISPLKLPNTQSIYSFPDISEHTFKGFLGVFADSLPDKFGNQLIDIYMAEKNIPAEEITALDKLRYIGTRGMGAIEYHPAEKLKGKDTENLVLDIHTLSELASLAASKLIRVGSSAGGAWSKALIAISPDGLIMDGTVNHGIHHSYWLLKFDNEYNRDRAVIQEKLEKRHYALWAVIRMTILKIRSLVSGTGI
ncbi:MAG: HipA N-terminal domain-containing protein [Spirochaetaceae bacterium]|nr:HipA N-terminal domain-containing protein [Spirochaetaceae bacterium]